MLGGQGGAKDIEGVGEGEKYEEVLINFKKEKKKVELVEPATRLMIGLWVLSGEQSDSSLEAQGVL